LQKDSKPAAVSALKRLLELEPDEIQHRRRLRELEGAPPEATPVAAAIHPETRFDAIAEQEATDFSAYDIQVTADAPVAAPSTEDEQWSQWSISTTEVTEAPPPFGSFAETPTAPEENHFFDSALPTFEVTEPRQEPSQLAAQASLRDELESVDFYLTQGMLDVARYTLETIAENFPQHPEVRARFAQLSAAETSTDRTVISSERQRETPVQPSAPTPPIEVKVEATFAPVTEPLSSFMLQMDHQIGLQVEPSGSGMPRDTEAATIFAMPPPQQPAGNAPVSLPSLFEAKAPTVELPTLVSAPSITDSFDLFAGNEMGNLLDFLDEFKAETEQRQTTEDFETHYNLGLAYKEMDMFDEAIEEFQQAFKAILSDPVHAEYVPCCNMLAFCFAQKGLPRLAVVWLKKALEAPGRGAEVYQALRYDLADAYAAMGSLAEAYEAFAEVYAVDVQYRGVKTRMQEIASQLGK
jgi:tetratricopeptide (TPR) repeat protein